MLNIFNKSDLTPQERLDQRRSNVRVTVTYFACAFVFLLAPILIGILLYQKKQNEALTVFNTVLPVAAGVISFWFAARSKNPEQPKNNKTQNNNSDG